MLKSKLKDILKTVLPNGDVPSEAVMLVSDLKTLRYYLKILRQEKFKLEIFSFIDFNVRIAASKKHGNFLYVIILLVPRLQLFCYKFGRKFHNRISRALNLFRRDLDRLIK